MSMTEFKQEKFIRDLKEIRKVVLTSKLCSKMQITEAELLNLEDGISTPNLMILNAFCLVADKECSEYFEKTEHPVLSLFEGNDKKQAEDMLIRMNIREKYENLSKK